jgi:hypothetical protein
MNKKMYSIILILQLTFSFVNAAETKPMEDKNSKPISITSTGPSDLSVGWEMISIRTELGDIITLDSNHDTGIITQVSISGRNNINVDLSLLESIRYPDFRSLNDIWYNYKFDKINSIAFEFNQIFDGKNLKDSRYKVDIEFEDEEIPDVIIWVFDPELKGWKLLDSGSMNSVQH